MESERQARLGLEAVGVRSSSPRRLVFFSLGDSALWGKQEALS